MKINQVLTSACSLLLLATAGVSTSRASSWKFGVLSDTQWVIANDGKNPESAAVDIVKQIDREFITKGVKLVIAVGDTVDSATPASLMTRALYSQDLYNAGIGFYPLRGNHDAGLVGSGTNFAYLYPQIINGGTNNLTPALITPSYIASQFTATDLGFNSSSAFLTQVSTTNPVATSNGIPFVVGSNFSYPASNCPPTGNNSGNNNISAQNGGAAIGNGGLSYAFDYNNTRFIILDSFVDTSAGGNTSSTSLQQSWITGLVSDVARPQQAFVFSHKNLLGGNHKDNLFGANLNGSSSDPGDGYGVTGLSATNTTLMTLKQNAEDAFITSLANNNVYYAIGGHDHHHKHSIVKSPLNSSKLVHELITQSASAKFYTPAAPYSANEVSVSEDLWEVGYYIFTVDGPRVTIDYYTVPSNTSATGSSSTGQFATTTPVLTGNWVKSLTNGYSLNGIEFLIPQGGSYTSIADSTSYAIAHSATLGETGFVGTNLTVLGGTNVSARATRDGRHLTKDIATGWTPANGTISDILTLWGLTELNSYQSDSIVIQLSFPTAGISDPTTVVLGAQDPVSGTWINAVDDNIVGGTKQFHSGAYNSSYGLGSYGVDLVGGVAWAVVNGNAINFAVISTPSAKLPWALNNGSNITNADLTLLMTAIRSGSKLTKYDLNGDGRVDAADARWLTQHFTHVGGN